MVYANFIGMGLVVSGSYNGLVIERDTKNFGRTEPLANDSDWDKFFFLVNEHFLVF